MKAHGNSSKKTCALNVLSIVRGEAPYARTKGVDPRTRDGSADEQRELTLADARNIVDLFEPRVQYGAVEVSGNAQTGDLNFIINMSGKEENNE